jgi:hypothetical protein
MKKFLHQYEELRNAMTPAVYGISEKETMEPITKIRFVTKFKVTALKWNRKDSNPSPTAGLRPRKPDVARPLLHYTYKWVTKSTTNSRALSTTRKASS